MATAKPMKLILSTRNSHKVGEIRGLLPTNFQFWTLADFPGAPQVVEDARTFAGNASKKAVELAEWLADRPEVRDSNAPSADAGVYVLADDSGLEVDALAGEPGVHSARFAALDSGDSGNSPDRDNNDKLLRLLQEIHGKSGPPGFDASLHWRPCRGLRQKTDRRFVRCGKRNCSSNFSMAPVKAESALRPKGRPDSATIHFSFRRDSSRRLRNWARTRKTKSATARKRWKN